MGILAVDELMLREPRLLTPGLKPLGPVKIERAHPAAKNLRYYNLINSRGDLRDLTGGYAPATIVDTVGFATDRIGRHADFTAAGAIQLYPSSSSVKTMLGNPTQLSGLIVCSAANPGIRTTMFGDWSDAGGGSSTIVEFTGYTVEAGSLCVMIGDFVDGNSYARAKTGCSANTVYAVTFSWDGSTTRTWANGVVGGTASTGTQLPPYGTQFPALGQGGAYTPLRATGKIYAFALWDARVTDALMAALSADPYQFLVPA